MDPTSTASKPAAPSIVRTANHFRGGRVVAGERSKLIWIGLIVGSGVGGYLPALWGADLISISAVIGSAIGGIVGIWLGFRMGE